MRICKYCNKPIAEKVIWNPDNDGNGYHHQCLIDMEFKARDKQIYDKGKMDVLDKIKAEIESKYQRAKAYNSVLQMNAYTDCLQIIERYRIGANE